MQLLLQATTLAQWHEILVLAQQDSGISLNADLESYLVFLTMRYTSKPEFWSGSIGLSYLNSLATPGSSPSHALREVGDSCLLQAGLFPQRAMRKSLSPEYFVTLGQQAYWHLAQRGEQDALFEALALQFKSLKSVLSAIRVSAPQQSAQPKQAVTGLPNDFSTLLCANDKQIH